MRPDRAGSRVVVVDDHVVFSESLELALDLEGHDAVSVSPNSFSSFVALLSRVLRLKPQVVLLDLDLGPLGDGRRLISSLVSSRVQVVVVTAATDRARWGEAVALGARRVLSKSGSLNEILQTVRDIDRGLSVMTEDERRTLIDLARSRAAEHSDLRARLEQLTPRESAVLGRLMLGETVREVAAHYVVGEATVRTQVKAILAKLGVSSQLAAVGVAHRTGWRPPDPG